MIEIIQLLLLLSVRHKLKIQVIDYFHPEGRNMPNGICYQRGYFYRQCEENSKRFQISDIQGNILKIPYMTGFIVLFPTKTEIFFTNNKYHHGCFFFGEYKCIDNDKYDKNSVCIYIDDKNMRETLMYARKTAKENEVQHFIVKDFVSNKLIRATI